MPETEAPGLPMGVAPVIDLQASSTMQTATMPRWMQFPAQTGRRAREGRFDPRSDRRARQRGRYRSNHEDGPGPGIRKTSERHMKPDERVDGKVKEHLMDELRQIEEEMEALRQSGRHASVSSPRTTRPEMERAHQIETNPIESVQGEKQEGRGTVDTMTGNRPMPPCELSHEGEARVREGDTQTEGGAGSTASP